jgi:hypothetical protein
VFSLTNSFCYAALGRASSLIGSKEEKEFLPAGDSAAPH